MNRVNKSTNYQETLTVGNWMTPAPYVIEAQRTYRDAALMMNRLRLDCLPVIDHQQDIAGIVTLRQVLNILLTGDPDTCLEGEMRKRHFITVKPEDRIQDVFTLPHKQFLVVNETQQLIGILTRRDMLDAFSKHIYRLQQMENTADVLQVILESAYEGIAVVDENGLLLEFNEAYSRFTGVKREDAVGRHVTEVIDNTNLHMTVKTGIPDRGVLQTIQGQPMVVHRIPIWNGEKVTGAIGMLIFEGVTEVYGLLERIQKSQVDAQVLPKSLAQTTEEDSRITFDQVISVSESMAVVKRMARKAARTTATVLITGESGTGKEIFAKSIHHLSPHFNGPFISVNCGAIPEQLFESELFGYEEGSFTGAKKGGKPGKFELAENGTLFLDEIGELSLVLQTKLLRVLQEKEAERVGGITKYKVNVRIIAATNQHIEQMVEEGAFREDLYYRLNIIRLHLPALRERTEDIPALLSYYVKKVCDNYGIAEKQFTSDAVAIMMNSPWKGNIRELVNRVEQLVTMVDERIVDAYHLEGMTQNPPSLQESESRVIDRVKRQSAENEKDLIIRVLEETGGNKSKAAAKLGIHRTTLYQKLKKYKM
ncbi:sigma-54-dependent Fis family transcriptional regulator [Domibacillus robiginosus]|uniref:sigma-54-dependent Fis family transcriptional regulator n=1 Tax=Domibacillus robiginosus TaxID=1071054 RepID=UPI00067CDE09|nr:sigma-54-dependent Fis family transcriptional regulator [Domibacillus robiginosus]